RHSVVDLLGSGFSDAEDPTVAALPEADRADVVFTAWARKEAVMEAAGLGLKIPRESATLTPPGQRPAVVGSAHDAVQPASTALVDLQCGPGYAAAVAALTPNGLAVTQQWWQSADFRPQS